MTLEKQGSPIPSPVKETLKPLRHLSPRMNSRVLITRTTSMYWALGVSRITLNLHSDPTGTNVILILQMEMGPEEVTGLAHSVIRYHIPWQLNAVLTPLFISQKEKGTNRYQVAPQVTCVTCLKAALLRLHRWLPGQNTDVKHCRAEGQTGVWNRKVAFSSSG